MIVVSDTSPICYLILIEQISLLPRLYGHVVIPDVVRDELGDCRSPLPVQKWMAQIPDWLTVQSVDRSPDLELPMLDPGERAAVLLVEQLQADVLLIDDRVGRQVARSRRILVIGTLGVLEEAGGLGWIDLPNALEQLQKTSFRASTNLIQQILERYRLE